MATLTRDEGSLSAAIEGKEGSFRSATIMEEDEEGGWRRRHAAQRRRPGVATGEPERREPLRGGGGGDGAGWSGDGDSNGSGGREFSRWRAEGASPVWLGERRQILRGMSFSERA